MFARPGVAPSRVVLPQGPWPRVLDFLVERFPAIDEASWRSRMARGLVSIEDGELIGADTAFRAGVTVLYYRELEQEPEIPFEAPILFQDAQLLVADKPHFLPVMPSGRFLEQTLLVRLKRQTGIETLAPLHRIDRGTAGLVLFSVDPGTRSTYQQLFAQRRVHKEYEAIAATLARDFPLTRRSRIEPGRPFFTMREVEGEPNSETRIERVRASGHRSLYRLFPVSGRKHQLRVHMAAVGAPIENDPLYPTLREEQAGDWSRPLQLLARVLAFDDPVIGGPRRFESARRLKF